MLVDTEAIVRMTLASSCLICSQAAPSLLCSAYNLASIRIFLSVSFDTDYDFSNQAQGSLQATGLGKLLQASYLSSYLGVKAADEVLERTKAMVGL